DALPPAASRPGRRVIAGLLPAGNPVGVHDVGIPRIGRQRPRLPPARSMTALAFLDLSHEQFSSRPATGPAASPLATTGTLGTLRRHPASGRHPKVDMAGGIFRGGGEQPSGGIGPSGAELPSGIRCFARAGRDLRRLTGWTIVFQQGAAL